MGLRYPVTIRRRAAGAYVGGHWVPGALGPGETIRATVQPATLSDYDMMEALPEGRRVEGMVRIYTDAVLQIAGQSSAASGDVLESPPGFRVGQYVIMGCSIWQSRVLPHYRYLAAIIPPAR